MSIKDIEKLVFHTDEVLTQIRLGRGWYWNNLDLKNTDEEEILDILRERQDHDEKYLDFIRLNPIRNLCEVNNTTLEEIIEKYLQPHLALALQLFRKGVVGMPYYVDDSVSDEYLIALLAIRCKDVLRIFGIQEEKRQISKDNLIKG